MTRQAPVQIWVDLEFNLKFKSNPVQIWLDLELKLKFKSNQIFFFYKKMLKNTAPQRPGSSHNLPEGAPNNLH